MVDSLFKENEFRKKPEFQRNEDLDKLILQLKDMLQPLQRQVEQELPDYSGPSGFIIGAPRSGTTLLLQWLASTEVFSYPTNLLSRFAFAPYLGALIQKMLFDPRFDFSGEFSDLRSSYTYSSTLGKSKGVLAPSEFQHFFRNYMGNFDPEFLDEALLQQVDFLGMRNGISSIARAFEKPFICKAIMLQLNLVETAERLPDTLFLYIHREPLANMQSLLLARERYYGSRDIWWSVKPREYTYLKDLDVFHQVAGQVFFTNRSITQALASISESRHIDISYRELCLEPQICYEKVTDLFYRHGIELKKGIRNDVQFEPSEQWKLKDEELDLLQSAYDEFTKTDPRCLWET